MMTENTMNKIERVLTPRVRRYLYGVAIAFVPLAVYLGWLAPEATPIVLPLILALLNVPKDGATDSDGGSRT